MSSSSSSSSVGGSVGANIASTHIASTQSFFERNEDTFKSAASLLNTSVSAYASYQSSIIKSNMMKIQARQKELQARNERLKGVQQSNILREQLLNNLSSVTAILSARGVDVGSRSATALAAKNITTARKDIDMIQSNAELRALGAETTAGTKRIGAVAARSKGRSDVTQQLFGETSTRSISSLLRGTT